MRRLLFSALLLTFMSVNASAQAVKQLPTPEKNLSMTLMDALNKRHSERSFSDQPLSDQQLSQILWAACGVNRADGRRTNPTAINAQDIDVYVCTKDGASLYNAKDNTLTEVTNEDIREILAQGQENMKNAPVFLLIVSDQSRFHQRADIYGAMDAGYTSQNIYLVCTAMGLKTVARAMMNKEAVSKALGLGENIVLELNHPIGY